MRGIDEQKKLKRQAIVLACLSRLPPHVDPALFRQTGTLSVRQSPQRRDRTTRALARLAARKRREIVREETRVEHHDKEILPDDLRLGIEEIRKAIPDIFKRLGLLESQTVDDVDGICKQIKNLGESMLQFSEARKQMVAQGAHSTDRIEALEKEFGEFAKSYGNTVSALQDLGVKLKSLDDTEKTEAA